MKARTRGRKPAPVKLEEARPLFVLSLLGLVGVTLAGLSGDLSPWASGFLVGVVSVVVLGAAGILAGEARP